MCMCLLSLTHTETCALCECVCKTTVPRRKRVQGHLAGKNQNTESRWDSTDPTTYSPSPQPDCLRFSLLFCRRNFSLLFISLCVHPFRHFHTPFSLSRCISKPSYYILVYSFIVSSWRKTLIYVEGGKRRYRKKKLEAAWSSLGNGIMEFYFPCYLLNKLMLVNA